MEKKNRKRRSDRNHVIYEITCRPTGQRYRGLTVARERAFKKSVEIRWKGHVIHATKEQRPTPLCEAIRQYGENAFSRRIIEIVRGKENAHTKETVLIGELDPSFDFNHRSLKHGRCSYGVAT